mgnify:CR=1 FL=1
MLSVVRRRKRAGSQVTPSAPPLKNSAVLAAGRLRVPLPRDAPPPPNADASPAVRPCVDPLRSQRSWITRADAKTLVITMKCTFRPPGTKVTGAVFFPGEPGSTATSVGREHEQLQLLVQLVVVCAVKNPPGAEASSRLQKTCEDC